MSVRIGPAIGLAAAVEAAAIAILAVLVAIFGPRDPPGAQAHAEHLGRFVGPISAAVLCFAVACWWTRRMESRRVLHGFLLGAACAAIDLALLLPLGGRFDRLIFISNAGRIIAGTLGGWLAAVTGKP